MHKNSEDFLKREFELSDSKKEKYYKYYELIHEYNKVMNLTGIDDLEGVYLKHFYDSLMVTKYHDFKNLSSIADVGSGAGFPGIVLAIYFPNISFSLIEPLKKRCNFLEIVVRELSLSNVHVINKRCEELTEKYDMVISRAVARLNVLLELCIPLVKKKGLFVAMKGLKADEEINEASNAMKILCCSVAKKQSFYLPSECSKRVNIFIEKNFETNKKYPRNFSQIKSKPL